MAQQQQYGYGYGYQAYGYAQPAAAAGYVGYATARPAAYVPAPHVPPPPPVPAPQQQSVGYSPYTANAAPTHQTQGGLKCTFIIFKQDIRYMVQVAVLPIAMDKLLVQLCPPLSLLYRRSHSLTTLIMQFTSHRLHHTHLTMRKQQQRRPLQAWQQKPALRLQPLRMLQRTPQRAQPLVVPLLATHHTLSLVMRHLPMPITSK